MFYYLVTVLWIMTSNSIIRGLCNKMLVYQPYPEEKNLKKKKLIVTLWQWTFI